jgi:hypothetical protein
MPGAANLNTSGAVERASGIRMLVSLKGIDMTTAAPPSHQTIRSVLLGLLLKPYAYKQSEGYDLASAR